jgi:3-oxoacyl-[acyl-carrier protein] reductase
MTEDKQQHGAAVVTGGARGIGAAIARRLAADGYPVALWDVNRDGLDEMVDELKSAGQRAVGRLVDVTDYEDVTNAAKEVAAEFGGIAALVNNAGITRDALFVRMKPVDWELVLKINLTGAFNCCRAVARMMMKARRGRIVNIASVVGLMGNASQANYAASKAGMLGLTKSLAKELGGRGVTVNAVAPGFIETEMTKLPEEIVKGWLELIPLKRAGTPQDVAGVVRWLCSPEAAYITGQVVNIDGGMVM